MERLLVGGALTVLVLSGTYALVQSNRGAVPPLTEGSVEIVLSESGFLPREVSIKKGTTVTFTTTLDRPFWPASNLHPSHDIYPEFDPLRPLLADESWGFTFERAGKHTFHDHIRSYFTGVVYVTE